jgi:nucleoside-diphosphate-sugar epimerase
LQAPAENGRSDDRPSQGGNHGRHVLVTGGAGFLGINLIRYLLARGHAVTSLDREPFGYPEAGSIREVRGDIRDPEAVRRALAGVDVVVHGAAALPLYAEQEILSTDIGGTRTVVEQAVRAGVERFVHISSTAVYGVPDHHPLFEDDQLVGVGPYGKAKIAAERICEGYRDQMIVPILRPKTFIGPERLGVFALLYDWAHTGHNFPIPGKGSNLYQYLDVEDLCDAIFRAATHSGEHISDTFNVGATDFGTFKGDFQAVLDHAGHGKRVVSLPAMPAIWVLRALDRLGLSPLYPWVYETTIKDSFVATEKAQRVLGWQPRYSNIQALIRNYDWYVANLGTFARQSGVTHRVPWKQGALALAKRLF